MDIVQRLRQHITDSKLKATEVAMAAGVPPDRLRKWLEGRGKPKALDSAKIESYLKGEIPEQIPAMAKDSERSVPLNDITAKYISLLEEVRSEKRAGLDALLRRLEELERIAKANHDILNKLTTRDEKILEERPAYTKRGAPSGSKK